MKIKTKLILGATVIALIPVAIVSIAIGWISTTSSHESLESEAKDQLVSIRDIKKSEIERYFETLKNQVLTFSNDRMIIDAMKDFNHAFRQFKNEASLGETNDLRGQLSRYYTDEFGKTYKDLNHGDSADTAAILNKLDADSIALQYAYISANPNPLGSKDALDSARDVSEYSRLHKKYHPHIRDFLQKFGYYDIFLVDPQSGDIVYSVFKELDFTTSMKNGPYANTGIAEAFRGSNDVNDPQHVTLTDFAPYTPSYEAPAAFISSPIYDGNEKVGVLIFQMPIDGINAIMTHNERWAQTGLGSSGETYLVGHDFKMRSMSRFLIEDKKGYLDLMRQVGLDNSTIDLIDAKGTSIGFQPVETQGTKAALKGITDFQIFPDYRNIPVLSAYAPLEVEGLDWVIMSEIDKEEAFAAADQLTTDILTAILITSMLIIVVAVGCSMVFAGSITRPINKMIEMIKDVAEGEGDLTARLDETAKDEFGTMAHWINTFIAKLQTIITDISTLTGRLSDTATDTAAITEQSQRSISQQKAQTEQVATAINEMSATVHEVASNALNAENAAKEANDAALQGVEVVGNTITAINALANEIERASTVIHQLESGSDKIGDIVNVINDIAEQTNLLALNAAIEAARAGEQGRGFAVVADEVRTLASRTQTSTEEIRQMIENLQSDSTHAVKAMDDSKTKAQSGVDLAAQAGQSLDTITVSVGTITEMNSQIASAAEEQSAVAEEINKNILHINQIADETATGAEQTADSSEKLATMSQQLQKLVDHFRV